MRLIATFTAIAFLFSLNACQTTEKALEPKAEQKSTAMSTLITEARPITMVGPRAGEGYFSHDGREMVFQSEREPGNPFYQIYLRNLENGQTKRLSPGHGKTTCAWIHPNKKIALFSSTHLDPKAREKQKAEIEFRKSGQQRRYSWDYDETYEIFEVQTKSGKLKRLTHELGYDAEASYSPDGRWIAFASNRAGFSEKLDGEDAKRFKDDPSYMMDIYIMKADGSNVKRLTTSKGYDGGPFFSPDSKRITWRRFTPDGHTAEVFTMNIDGSDVQQLTKLKSMSWAPFYHPSGDYLIFTTNIHGYQNFELYLVDVKGEKAPVRVTEVDGFDGLPVFTPDGQHVSWTRRGPQGDSQIYIGKWNDNHARKLLGLEQSQWKGPSFPTFLDSSPIKLTEADGKKWISYLASNELKGRATGSSHEAEYMGKIGLEFKDMGLKPIKDSFLHPFAFTSGVKLGAKNVLSVVSSASEHSSLVVGKDWLPLSFTRSGSIGATPIALAGYGIVAPSDGTHGAFDTYQGIDVKDKWVMLFRYTPEKIDPKKHVHLNRYAKLEHKVMMARERGAKGVLIVTGPSANAKSDLIPLKMDRGGASPSSLPVISISDRLAESLLKGSGKNLKSWQEHFDTGATEGLSEINGVKLAGHIEIETQSAQATSTVAILQIPGAKKTLVIGAHGDHLGQGYTESSLSREKGVDQIHFGADDNASGVAAVIEMARYFSQPEVKKNLKYNLAFAIWSGEELGNLGSTAFLNSLPATDRKNLVGYVNMDMIGRYQDKLLVQGIGSSKIWLDLIERRAGSTKLAIHTNSDPYLPTDSMAFYLNEIPTLSFFTGTHTEYHTPQDREELINYPAWVETNRFITGLVHEIASRGTVIPYEKVEKQKGSGGGNMRSFRIYLGTIPDYSQEKSKGVKLSGVIKGGPAEAAGLKTGDVIVGISDYKIETINDYVYSLQSMRPNTATKITVVREGKTLDLNITPAARE